MNYQNHLVKYTFALYDPKNKNYSIDIKYIKKCYKACINDLDEYYKFAFYCIKDESEKNKLLSDEEYLEEQTDIVTPKFENEDGKGLIGPGLMVRNLIHHTNMMMH